MLNKKGQAAVETIVIAVVLLGLFLATVIIMTQRNSDTNKIMEAQKDIMRCEKLASTVTNFNSNKDYSETLIRGMEKTVSVKSGSIAIGTVYCRYVGKVELYTAGTGYVADITGFELTSGTTYTLKTDLVRGVVFCDIADC